MKLIIALALCFSTAFAGIYPDKILTPGDLNPAVSQDTLNETICKSGYTKTIRAVTEEMHREVFALYGIPYSDHSLYEDDHFLSLELGGSNENTNRWPQAYCPAGNRPLISGCWGAREKDVVENHLHREICRGNLTLKEAQAKMLNDWIAEYKTYKQ
jgi:hypothetical protein